MDSAFRPPGLRLAAICAGLAAAVFVTALGAILLTRDYTEIAAVWPVNAIVLATILRNDKARWRLLLGVANAAILAANMAAGNGWIIAIFCSLANIVEILICAWAITRKAPGGDYLHQGWPFFVRLSGGAVAGSLGSAAIATIAITFHNDIAPVSVFWSWLISNGLGLVIFLPSLWALLGGNLTAMLRGSQTVARAVGLWGVFIAGLLLVFGQHTIDLLPLAPFLLVPLAFGLESGGIAIGIGVFSLFAIISTALGYGPITDAHAAPLGTLAFLQLFLALMGVLATPSAMAIAQRQRALRQLSVAHEENQRGREALAQIVRQWDTLAAASRDIIVRAGPGGIIRYVSPASRDILGIDPEEAIGRSTLDFVAPEDREHAMATLADALSSAGPDSNMRREFRATRSDGSIVWLEGRPGVIRNARGESDEFITMYRDITARRAAEQELAAAHKEREDGLRRWEAFAQASRDVIVRYLPDTTMTYVSPASASTLGYAPEELVGRRIQDFVHPDDLPRGAKNLSVVAKASPNNASVIIRLRTRHKNGDWRWIEGRPHAVVDPQSGAPTAYYDVFRDVTEQVALEHSLEDAVSRAEAAAEAKARFLANMSHELRTPLNSVIGYSRLLARSDEISARDRWFAQRVEVSSQATLSIVNDVLDAAALERGAVTLRTGPVAIPALLSDVATIVALQAQEKGLGVNIVADPGLAPLNGDRDRLLQIVLNLVSNAIKFTDEGGVTVTAALVADAAETQTLRIDVADTGVGIAAEHQNRIFERFAQVGEANRSILNASGLGLSIVKDLAELMGGSVSVASEAGRGSTFSVRLTLHKAAAEAAASTASVASGSPQRILVVDDVDLNRDLLVHLLAPYGHAIETAADGFEAVEKCRAETFDLILMDVRMPGMDGLEATRAIRASGLTVPVVAITAGIRPENIASCLAAGMNALLAKPIIELELLQAVAHWTEALPADIAMQSADPLVELRARFAERLGEERAALANADGPEAITGLAHRLAGSAGSFGFAHIGALARDLNDALVNSAPDWREKLIPLLRVIDDELGKQAA